MDSIFSADCHVIEPPSVWTARLPAEYRERGPVMKRVAAHEGLGAEDQGEVDWWFVEGAPALPAFAVQPGSRVKEGGARDLALEGQIAEMENKLGTDDYGPDDYVSDLNRDNTTGAILYPTTCLFLYRITDIPFLNAIFAAYNDWLAEFCAERPKELKGAAAICVDDVEAAVAEMRRTREKGLVTALIPVTPPKDRPYDHPSWDPLWAASDELNMPITFHVGTNRIEEQSRITQTTFVTFDNGPKTALSDMIFAGAFVKHPNLKVAFAEFELGWIPFFLDRLDYTYTQRRRREGWIDFPAGVLPSDFWKQNCSASFQEDPTVTSQQWDVIGLETIMFGTDFPHVESTFPQSLESARKVLADLSEEGRELICQGNPSRFFDLG